MDLHDASKTSELEQGPELTSRVESEFTTQSESDSELNDNNTQNIIKTSTNFSADISMNNEENAQNGEAIVENYPDESNVPVHELEAGIVMDAHDSAHNGDPGEVNIDFESPAKPAESSDGHNSETENTVGSTSYRRSISEDQEESIIIKDDIPENLSDPLRASIERSQSEVSLQSIVHPEEDENTKEALIEQYKQAVLEHKIAREANLQLQTKLAEYFRRKKADAAEQQTGMSSTAVSGVDNSVDYEQRYNKYITSLSELRNQYQAMQKSYHKQIEELKEICSERQKEVDEAYKEFTTYKYNVGKKALHSRTGRPVNPKELLAMLKAEQSKEAAVMEVRLENIKLRNEVSKAEALLKSKEELADGLHLIDFEQLKIENQTYNEKIEERNEELMKLKRKIASTVQIMTHVKEKLQAIQFDNAKQKQRLSIAEAELNFNRDQLTRLKQARDRLRTDNSKLNRACGLLGKNNLLLNFEDSVDAVNTKKTAIEETKRLTSQYANKTKALLDKMKNQPPSS